MSASIITPWATVANTAPIGPVPPGAGSNRLLPMLMKCESSLFTAIDTLTIGGVTYDGLTKISHATENTHIVLAWWKEASIASFSGTAVDFADLDNLGVDRIDNFTWAVYGGVDQTTPVTLQDSDTTTNSADTIDLTDGSSLDDQLLVAVARNSGNRDVTNWGGMTELYDWQPTLSNYRAAAATGVGGNGIITLTGDGIADDWLAGLWSINAAAAAPPGGSAALLIRRMHEGLMK